MHRVRHILAFVAVLAIAALPLAQLQNIPWD